MVGMNFDTTLLLLLLLLRIIDLTVAFILDSTSVLESRAVVLEMRGVMKRKRGLDGLLLLLLLVEVDRMVFAEDGRF